MPGGNKTHNRLWLSRKRKHLGLKQVARLLGHKSIDQISRYENGSRLPKLRNALKLEIILGVPVSLLFTELRAEVAREIRTYAQTSGQSIVLESKPPEEEHCSFNDLLTLPTVSEDVRQRIHRHCATLINTMNLMDNGDKEAVNRNE